MTSTFKNWKLNCGVARQIDNRNGWHRVMLSLVAMAFVVCACRVAVAQESEMLEAHFRNWIVTTPLPNAPASHQFNAAGPAFGIDVSGVARLFLDTNPTVGLGSRCTASLISDRHLLTAAHCVTDAVGAINVIDGADGNTAHFDTAAIGNPDISIGFVSAGITKHPNYNGNTAAGYDVAIIKLLAPVPAAAAQYGLNAVFGAELGVPHVKVGYGRYGNGADGQDGAFGGIDNNRRAGQNEWEDDGLGTDGVDFGISNVVGITNNPTQLTFDFDSGLAANDAFASGVFNFPKAADLGFGVNEIGAAPGDSGGPTFIQQGSNWVIAGVTSYGISILALGTDADVGGLQPDSSFGELSVDARVAQNEIYNFIITTVPEPNGMVLCVMAVAFLARRRRN